MKKLFDGGMFAKQTSYSKFQVFPVIFMVSAETAVIFPVTNGCKNYNYIFMSPEKREFICQKSK
ncbi:MAG: hypothetical protein CVU97_01800 [Firmicutes bacterium HGW-Firmicutes-21]|nr:MAG: hypothetical protein CVU97_01800 [Firmicutes bacterium HGW-Firmicutes-21]